MYPAAPPPFCAWWWWLWWFTTGGALFVEGPGHSAKAQKPSAKALPSTALGKEPSEKKLTAKRLFAEGHLPGTRQRKAAVNGAAPLTAPLPSADS